MSTSLERFYGVIPAGGVGSRLWPLSRADAPKFLHDLTGSGRTLLRGTWERLAPLAGPERVMVVTGRAHRAAVEAQIPELEDRNIVLEAAPRDSTVAIGLAAAILVRREPDVIIGSFAADHVIGDEAAFRAAVEQAVAAAAAGYIATIGIQPTEPVLVGLRPEHIAIDPSGKAKAEVLYVEPMGAQTQVAARAGTQDLVIVCPGTTIVKTGEILGLTIAPDNIHVFSKATGKRL